MFDFGALNWPALGVCFVAGQIFLTLYFTVILGDRWAKAYGPDKTRAEHTAEVPKYTYGIGAACTAALVLTVALLQAALGVQGVGEALQLGALIAFGLVAAAMLPGYAFLRKLDGGWLAIGSQVALTVMVSGILGAWPK